MVFDSFCRKTHAFSRLMLLLVVFSQLLGNTAMPVLMPADAGQTTQKGALKGCCCALAGNACQCASGCCGANSPTGWDVGTEDLLETAHGTLAWVTAPLNKPCQGLGAGSILLGALVLVACGISFTLLMKSCFPLLVSTAPAGIDREKPSAPPPKIQFFAFSDR